MHIRGGLGKLGGLEKDEKRGWKDNTFLFMGGNARGTDLKGEFGMGTDEVKYDQSMFR